ncbi:hypothetical protein FH972_021912 [Carpinus fangiana]|uniref:Glycoside hydrolase family 5 domain-containing protein n=1 Tax=Carpinus fangiana TaxID=176857 RepID=A0A5N6KR86_9ROSI|nr:hypothetical protein FH972_021912 [Carpinus fangiana]
MACKGIYDRVLHSHAQIKAISYIDITDLLNIQNMYLRNALIVIFAGHASAKVAFAGVNLAGCEIGMQTNVINQGGQSGGKLAETWSLLAKRYANRPKVVFGIMNEPHGSDQSDADFDINNWAGVLQQSVNAIRQAGAVDQWIFLLGRNYANAGAFPGTSADALKAIKNPGVGNENLIFEVHQYFDETGGKSTVCNQPNTSTFKSLGNYLRSVGRKAFIGEIGGGNGKDCIDLICPAVETIGQYSDVFLGWTSWAAGNWWPDYELLESPKDGQDAPIISSCFASKFTD